jgi:crotonobetainyl-CoA:carnitine CoA-transferase CaiB-like acyl-CoA transferase
MPSGVLAGLRVLDFGQYIAGPYCAALLADFGAEVLRIERPEGNVDRTLVPLNADETGDGALFHALNRNKASLALDLKRREARPVLERLLALADVVVANLPPRGLRALGLEWPRLHALNPKAILVTCTAYGTKGERRNALGFDGVGQAMSGAMHMTGSDGEPRKAYVNYVDFSTAVLSAFGVMLALRRREATGEGAHVETALLHTAVAMMATALLEEHVCCPGRVGTGNRSQLAAPADAFRTRDGWILVQTAGEEMFARVAHLVGRPGWSGDPRFAGDTARGRHAAEISAGVQAWCGARTSAECLAALDAAEIPAAPVLAPRETLAHPLAASEDWFRWIRLPGLATIPIVMPPVLVHGAPGEVRRPAPPLGADSRAALGGYGFSDAEIEALIASGVVTAS